MWENKPQPLTIDWVERWIICLSEPYIEAIMKEYEILYLKQQLEGTKGILTSTSKTISELLDLKGVQDVQRKSDS